MRRFAKNPFAVFGCLTLIFATVPIDTKAVSITSTASVPANVNCVYNRTRKLQVVISLETKTPSAMSQKPSLTLAAGTHFCCKPSDALCAGSTPLSWRVNVRHMPREIWCSEQGYTQKAITLPVSDSYLLVRDAREARTGKAPIEVDVMFVDGRLAMTIPCHFAA